MSSLAQWLEDFRWAMNAKRARAWRRKLSFHARMEFDDALRPRVVERHGAVAASSHVIAYPDAIYHITMDDVARAMIRSSSWPAKPPISADQPQRNPPS